MSYEDNISSLNIRANALEREYWKHIEKLKTLQKRKKDIEQLGNIISRVCDDEYPDVTNAINRAIPRMTDAFHGIPVIESINAEMRADREYSSSEDSNISQAMSSLHQELRRIDNEANIHIGAANQLISEINSLNSQIQQNAKASGQFLIGRITGGLKRGEYYYHG